MKKKFAIGVLIFAFGIGTGFIGAKYHDSLNPPKIVEGDFNGDGEKECGIAFKGKYTLQSTIGTWDRP